jgi:hypothetical protein
VQQQNLNTEVSLLAVLISVLNLSAMETIIDSNELGPYLDQFQKLVKVTHLAMPYVFKSVGLLAISNMLAQSSKYELLPRLRSHSTF